MQGIINQFHDLGRKGVSLQAVADRTGLDASLLSRIRCGAYPYTDQQQKDYDFAVKKVNLLHRKVCK